MKTFLIIDRLKSYFQVDTSNKLAEKLGVKPSTLTNWKVRNSIDWILIFTKCESINLNWLIYGEGSMIKSSYNEPLQVCESQHQYNNDYSRIIEENKRLIKQVEVLQRVIEEKQDIIDAFLNGDIQLAKKETG